MNYTDTILIVIAIGVWVIWYELRFGIEGRRYSRISAEKLLKGWHEESKAKWKEFKEARKDEKSWEAYLTRIGPVKSKDDDE